MHSMAVHEFRSEYNIYRAIDRRRRPVVVYFHVIKTQLLLQQQQQPFNTTRREWESPAAEKPCRFKHD